MFCSKCGAWIEEGSKFCPKCGNPTGIQSGGGRMVPPGKPSYKKPPKKEPTKKKKGSLGLIIAIMILLFLIGSIGGGAIYYVTVLRDEPKAETVRDRARDKENEDRDEENQDEEDRDREDGEDRKERGSSWSDITAAAQTQAPTAAETKAAETIAAETTAAQEAPATAQIYYSSQVNLSGMVKAGMVRETAFASSHLVQSGSHLDNSAWSAFDGQSTTSWQEGVDGDGIGQYLGISFDREYQVQAVTFLLGNHRSDDWYIRNNTPKTLTVMLGTQFFQVTFPKERTEFVMAFSRPVAASDIRITVDDVYKGTQYSDTIIAEVGVYGN